MSGAGRKRVPWLRFNVTTYQDPAVRLARCGAVYPWVLAQVKIHGNGKITREALHPDLAAMDLNIPPELAKEQIDAMFSRAICVEAPDGTVTIKGWTTYQPDNRPHSSERGKSGGPKSSQGVPREFPGSPRADGDGDGDKTLPPLPPEGGGAVGYEEPKGNDTRVVDGVVHYTAEGARSQMVKLWPDEHWHKPNHWRFAGEICRFPKAVVDAALHEARIREADRPWAVKRLCKEQAKAAKPVSVAAPPADRVAAQIERLRGDDRELRQLIDDCIGAKVAPPEPVRQLIVERLSAWNERIPELFRSAAS